MDEAANGKYFGKDLEAMSFAVRYHRWILEEFTPYLGNVSAEVGAGTGSFTRLMSDQVAKLMAFEPSENMYPALAEAFVSNESVTTYQSLFQDYPRQFAGSLDSVVYVNVMEHIEDDANEFGLIRSALAPGGHALVFVPALPWLYSDFDKAVGHYRRYKKQDLQKLASDAGFEIVKLKYFDLAGILPWYVAFVLLRKSFTSGSVSVYDKWVVPVVKPIERRIAPPIGKNLLLVARKS